MGGQLIIMIKDLIETSSMLKQLVEDDEITIFEKLQFLKFLSKKSQKTFIKTLLILVICTNFADMLINLIMPRLFNIQSYIPSIIFDLALIILATINSICFTAKQKLFLKTIEKIRIHNQQDREFK